jgi:hypothetical protein
MTYEITQHGRWHYLFFALSATMLAAAWVAREDRTVTWLLLGLAAVFLLCSLMFASLTIRDEGQWLALRFGPLPVFRKRFRYADITSAQPDRSKVIDGWGIHYIPGRGWTYNLWGFDCVRLSLGRKVVRVGSDDVQNLAAMLAAKIAENAPKK